MPQKSVSNDYKIFHKIKKLILHNNIQELKYFMDSGRADIDIADEMKRNLLWYACDYNRLDIVKWLIERNISLNSKESVEGYTCLKVALFSKELVQILLNAGADPNAQNNYGIAAVFQSLHFGETGVLEILMDAGANINGLFPFNYTSFYLRHYHQSFIIKCIEDHFDQLTSENKLLWKSMRLKFVFK